MAKVTEVDARSPAASAGLRVGDELKAINGHEIHDVLDLIFYSYEPSFIIDVERGGKQMGLRVKKQVGEPLGVEFESYLIDQPRSCHNKCVFCFIDQMPPGMRDTLYFKDDDARLSFLQGNYVTLTNLSDADLGRIVDMRISPINVSVHTTNPELRVKMLNNRFAGEKLAYLKTLSDGGVDINAQIVLCPGWNDRDELTRTLEDLAALDGVVSCSVVPVGLSKYRDGLAKLDPVTKEDALDIIERVDRVGEKCLETRGFRTFYCSDEIFLLAEKPLPDIDYYEDFPQLENGVGMAALFIDEFTARLDELSEDERIEPFTLATGTLFYPILVKLVDLLRAKWHNIDAEVVAIKNRFFGESITVAGLVTGGDLIDQLRGRVEGRTLILPSAMLRAGEDVFLDDVSVGDVKRELGPSDVRTNAGGAELLDAILGI